MSNWDRDSEPDFPSWFTGPMPDLSTGDCTTVDPELFFASVAGSHHSKVAKAVCAECPLEQECFEYAMSVPNLDGVWGGTTERERGTLRAQRAEEAA